MEVPTAIWASHLLGGVLTGMNPAYTTEEVEHQLTATGAICLFTCKALLPIALPACKNIKIILLDGGEAPGCARISDILKLGASLPELPKLKLAPGEGRKRLAFLSFSSGTTGGSLSLVTCLD